MEKRRRLASPGRAVIAAALLAGLALPACGGGGGTVEVTLQEWSVIPAEESAPAGEVTFEVENVGPNDPHELVVVKTDLAADALPTTEGKVDEEGEGIEFIGEIEEFPVGETQSQAFDLEPGNYVLFCNIVEEEEGGEIESHYEMGMRTGFTAE